MKTIFLLAVLFMAFTAGAQTYQYPFQNPDLPIEQRVDDLINRLTLEEKAKLMVHNSPAIERLGIQDRKSVV